MALPKSANSLQERDPFTGVLMTTVTALPASCLVDVPADIRPYMTGRHVNWMSALAYWKRSPLDPRIVTQLTMAVYNLVLNTCLPPDFSETSDYTQNDVIRAGPMWYNYTVLQALPNERVEHAIISLPHPLNHAVVGTVAEHRIPRIMTMYSGANEFKVVVTPDFVVWSEHTGNVNTHAVNYTHLKDLRGVVLILPVSEIATGLSELWPGVYPQEAIQPGWNTEEPMEVDTEPKQPNRSARRGRSRHPR